MLVKFSGLFEYECQLNQNQLSWSLYRIPDIVGVDEMFLRRVYYLVPSLNLAVRHSASIRHIPLDASTSGLEFVVVTSKLCHQVLILKSE